jgi:hypothetical protein
MMFPSLAEEYEKAADAFSTVSRATVIKGCVGSLDGCLYWIEVPSTKETPMLKHFTVDTITHRV